MRPLRKMRVCCWALVLTTFAAGALSACGEDDFENEPRPPVPVELTGVIQERGVTISPGATGAGPVLITISNQTDESHTVTLEGESLREQVGPVQPGDTATIQATLERGAYEVRAGSNVAAARPIPADTLTIGADRPPSNDRLLLP